MKRSPGECFMCKAVQDVRYFDLYVIGSEGCHLCLPCEIQVVEFARQAAGQALQKKKQEFKAKKHKDGCGAMGFAYPKNEECPWCPKSKPMNAYIGMVSG